MPTYRSAISSILQFVLLTIGMSAFAQRDPGQWVGDLYLVHRRTEFPMPNVLIDETNSVRLEVPSLAKNIDFPLPLRLRSMGLWSLWHKDALYTVVCGGAGTNETNENGTEFKRWSYAKWQEDSGWQFLGEYKAAPRELLTAIPCDNDRLIIISDKNDLTGNNNPLTRSPFHRMSVRRGKKELRLDSSIDYGIDELRKYMSDPTCFALAFDSRIVMTDRYATVINYNTGLYWIFSLEKASLIRNGKIFKKVTTDMIAKGGFGHAVLCANPEKDGTVLISTQEEAAFMTETGDALKELNETLKKNPDLSIEDAKKILLLRQSELADKNPLIVWYRLYPEEGRIEKCMPIGAAFVRDGRKKWLCTRRI